MSENFLQIRWNQLSLPDDFGAMAVLSADSGLPRLGWVLSATHFAQLHAGG